MLSQGWAFFKDDAVAERVRIIIHQRDKQEIKRTIHAWGAALFVTQLALGSMIVYLGNRVLNNLEGRTL